MRLILIFILTTFSVQTFANENTNDLWFGTFSTKPLTAKYSLWTEAQMRFDLNQNEMQQTLFRTGLLYSLTQTQGIGLLYAYIETGEISEHRLALQHTLSYGTFLGAKASHRIRVEARRFENLGFGSERLRYLARLQFNTKNSLIPVTWNEIFINSRKEELTGNTFIDRNRLFLGFRKVFKDSQVTAEFGYLNQFVPRDSEDLMEHVLVAYLFF